MLAPPEATSIFADATTDNRLSGFLCRNSDSKLDIHYFAPTR
jgi:hypothetical protein